jgi:hypothetical protein
MDLSDYVTPITDAGTALAGTAPVVAAVGIGIAMGLVVLRLGVGWVKKLAK